MPSYDYRCPNCGDAFTLTFKSVAEYAAAQPVCATCGYTDVQRVITRVAIQKPGRDYRRMDATDMLRVFESGDGRAVGEMMTQVAGPNAAMPPQYHDAAQKLRDGESMDKVEKSLTPPAAPAPTPPAKP